MQSGTIVMLVIIIAIFAFAGFVLYKSVAMANKREKEGNGEEE